MVSYSTSVYALLTVLRPEQQSFCVRYCLIASPTTCGSVWNSSSSSKGLFGTSVSQYTGLTHPWPVVRDVMQPLVSYIKGPAQRIECQRDGHLAGDLHSGTHPACCRRVGCIGPRRVLPSLRASERGVLRRFDRPENTAVVKLCGVPDAGLCASLRALADRSRMSSAIES